MLGAEYLEAFTRANKYGTQQPHPGGDWVVIVVVVVFCFVLLVF